MGYRYRGFFSDGDDTVMGAALERWPFCIARRITSPFCGFGLRAPDPEDEAESDEDYERILELPYAVERGLPDFSRSFPTVTFVFIHADCVGGICIYKGYVAQAGEITLRVESAEPGWQPLQRLLQALGVQLRSRFFEPFVRGYWGVA